MHTLDDIIIEDEFFLTPYTESNAVACVTKGLTLEEFIIRKSDIKDFFFFLKNNTTNILSEIEKDLQSLCTKDNRDLLTAMIDINLSIDFVTNALRSCVTFDKENMVPVFTELLAYLTYSKIAGSNLIAFEGYEKIQ